MKKTFVVTLAFAIVILAGCEDDKKAELQNKSAELEKQLAEMQTQSTSLQQDVADRDKYINDVMGAVNKVYKNLESAKTKESKLLRSTKGLEGEARFTNEQVRQSVLDQISAINMNLKDSRKRISDLQQKLNASETKYASLDQMVQNLKQTLEEREKSIAALQTQIDGLEGTVADQTHLIEQKDTLIEGQQNRINTVYYVIGKKDELKEKGIITDEGGFPWGLFGSTTVVSGKANEADFKQIDLTQSPAIHVGGRVVDILPRRSEESFQVAQEDDNNGEVMIKHPDKFWREKYLVIVVD